MRAQLHPLKGKYYVTKMTVTLDDGREVCVELSSSDDTVSPRVLRDDPEFLADGGPWDGHYERAATNIVATRIWEELNDD